MHVARRFRTLYFSSQRSGAIGETIGPRQVSIARLHRLSSEPRLPRGLADVIDGEPIQQLFEGLVDPEDPSRGVVRHDWYAARCMGSARIGAHMQIVNLVDGATVQHLRQVLAPVAIELGVNAWECWAMFDRRLVILDTQVAQIDITDSDFAEAVGLLHLSVETENGTIIRHRSSSLETRSDLLGEQAEGFGVGSVERLADEVLDAGFDHGLVVDGDLFG